MIALLDAQKENGHLVSTRLFALVCWRGVRQKAAPSFFIVTETPALCQPHNPISRSGNFDYQGWSADAVHHHI